MQSRANDAVRPHAMLAPQFLSRTGSDEGGAWRGRGEGRRGRWGQRHQAARAVALTVLWRQTTRQGGSPPVLQYRLTWPYQVRRSPTGSCWPRHPRARAGPGPDVNGDQLSQDGTLRMGACAVARGEAWLGFESTASSTPRAPRPSKAVTDCPTVQGRARAAHRLELAGCPSWRLRRDASTGLVGRRAFVCSG